MSEFDISCRSYCSHGGVCVLEEGHAGLHDSRYCTWSDEEAMPKEEADQRYLEMRERICTTYEPA